jgi:hypothetical protein
MEEEAAMDEHERTARAAQRVGKLLAFYIHLAVFVFVCAGLFAVNLLVTPEVWWAQWPFLGWGLAVLGHTLCALGRGPNVIQEWRLRKIRELAHPESAGGTRSTHSSPMRAFGILVLGILFGCAVGGGYVYTLLQDARKSARNAEASRATLDNRAKEQEAQLKQVQEQVGQLQTSRQAVEQALKEARDKLAEAQSAREATERALAEVKKGQ